ncbi:hypothetical protein PGT21_015453 [Puccinia graminis f. sp. tritici]|uniref:Uncharacterized protein n=1 Tax=Puccinia graminis f. sp. tritici TaxID=56615 RepID=A0A5B0Q2Z9_PUCGR|nr:hypothetical protein PGT21_015453 [Puccinia graminis f. sp. tritici]KAA1124710.1 hypothetical protein PGTUg99_031997 [Puccinia graminis f. sp. tritici]
MWAEIVPSISLSQVAPPQSNSMPSTNQITCHLIHAVDPTNRFPELLPNIAIDGSATCYVPVESNPNPNPDYGSADLPYSVHWSIDPSLLATGGLQVQIQVDGCQKGQPRSYEAIGPDGLTPPSPITGIDDGLWVVPDGTRRRPWVMGEIKTTHPHSALSDKYILDRVGSVSVTFSRANVVPTSRVVALTPVFSGSAPLPDRMREKLSHWTRLGFIENHPPGAELGLVAEEIHEPNDPSDRLTKPMENALKERAEASKLTGPHQTSLATSPQPN